MPKKGELGQFANLSGGRGEGGWKKEQGGIFDGRYGGGGVVDTPMHTTK